MFCKIKIDSETKERLDRVIDLNNFVIKFKSSIEGIQIYPADKKQEGILALSEQNGFSLFEVNSAWHRVYGEPLFSYDIFRSELSELGIEY